MVIMKRMSMMLFLLLAVSTMSEARRRKGGGVCGLTCYRWKKCKGVLATLTDTSGDTRCVNISNRVGRKSLKYF